MGARRTVAVGLLALAALGLWSLWPGAGPAPVVPPRATVSGPVTPVGRDTVTTGSVERVETVDGGSRAGSGERTAVRLPTAGDVERPADGAERAAHGRIALQFADGTRLERESGRIRLTAYRGGRGFGRGVVVRDGVFELPTISGSVATRLRLESGELGGRTVVPQEAGAHWDALEGGPPQLVARPARGLTLRAVAAESGTVLDGVVAYGLSRTWLVAPGPLHPGFARERGEPFAGPGPSPLAVASETTATWGRLDTHLLVGASGRVWRAVPIDGRPEGELVVELEPAGAIELRVTGVESGAGLRFELERTAGSGVAVIGASLRSDLSETLDGLAPGAWTGRVARGIGSSTRAVYAEAEVEVVAGATVALELAVPPEAYAREATHPTELRLEIPAAWNVGRTYWNVERVDPPDGDTRRRADWLGAADAVEGDLEHHLLDLGSLPVGDYVVSIERPPATVAFQVDGTGASRARVPPPSEVRVAVVEPDGVTPAAVERFVWRPEVDSGTYTSFEVSAEPGTSTFRFEAPRQPLGLTLLHGDGSWHHARLEVDRAPFEHTWVLERRARIEVTYLLDGRPHAIEPDAFVGARIEDASGAWPRNTSRDHTREATLFHVPPGTRVRLVPPRFPGFVTPAPLDLTPELGGVLELVFEYLPEPR